MGNPKRNCPFILQIIMLCLLQRLHRREIPTPPFYIFSKARKPLILLDLRRFCFYESLYIIAKSTPFWRKIGVWGLGGFSEFYSNIILASYCSEITVSVLLRKIK